MVNKCRVSSLKKIKGITVRKYQSKLYVPFVITVISLVFFSLVAKVKEKEFSSIESFFFGTMIFQNWSMFAPEGPKHNDWIEILGKTESEGEVSNLLDAEKTIGAPPRDVVSYHRGAVLKRFLTYSFDPLRIPENEFIRIQRAGDILRYYCQKNSRYIELEFVYFRVQINLQKEEGNIKPESESLVHLNCKTLDSYNTSLADEL
jgi:hypothetical protein